MQQKWFIKHLRLILTALLMMSFVAIAEITGVRSDISAEYIKTIFNQYGLLSYAIYIFLFTFANLIQIPGWIFLAAAIYSIGNTSAYFLTYTAAIVSSILCFFIINLVGGSALKKIEITWVNRLVSKINDYPIRVNIILRTIFQTAPPLNYTLALSGIKFKDYLLGAIIGLPIPILIFTIFIDFFIKRFI